MVYKAFSDLKQGWAKVHFFRLEQLIADIIELAVQPAEDLRRSTLVATGENENAVHLLAISDFAFQFFFLLLNLFSLLLSLLLLALLLLLPFDLLCLLCIGQLCLLLFASRLAFAALLLVLLVLLALLVMRSFATLLPLLLLLLFTVFRFRLIRALRAAFLCLDGFRKRSISTEYRSRACELAVGRRTSMRCPRKL